jgi:anti-sigma-K factor RskA
VSRAEDDEQVGRPDDLRELVPAYALGALGEVERDAFERELARSTELQDEVDSFHAVTAELGEAVEPVAPPAWVKASIFEQIDADATAAPPAVSAAPESGRAHDPQPRTPAAGAETFARGGAVDELAARRSRRRLAIALSSAAAVVLIAAGVVFGLNWPGPNGWGAQQQLSQLASASDAQTETIEAVGGGEITLVWSEEHGRSAVRTQDLPDVGDGRTYELWYIDDSGATPAGTFDASGEGGAWRILEGEFAPGVVVGVTVEPAGGSEQPTTEPIAAITT